MIAANIGGDGMSIGDWLDATLLAVDTIAGRQVKERTGFNPGLHVRSCTYVAGDESRWYFTMQLRLPFGARIPLGALVRGDVDVDEHGRSWIPLA